VGCNTPEARDEQLEVRLVLFTSLGERTMKRHTAKIVLAGSIASAIAMLAGPAVAQDTEKCYGVALKGQNDCKAGAHDCKGHSTVNYDGRSFKLVPKGTCTAMKTPKGMGSLKPKKT
jgi:uncharacterized membrane protein